MSDESKIIPCYEAPDDWHPSYSCDLPCKGPIPPSIRKLGVERVIGRTIVDGSCHMGSYGMGGPGFLGLSLQQTEQYPLEVLVLCLWGSDEWVLYDSLPIFAVNQTYKTYGQKKFCENVRGKVVKSFDIADKSCKIMLNDTPLEITENSEPRPTYGGTGGQRVLHEKDSLLDAWVIASKPYIYI